MTRGLKADGSDSDVVLPRISTCDHDQSSARPWRPTGAGKPSRCTRRSSTVRALFRPSRAATSWASTDSSPSVSHHRIPAPLGFPLPRSATSLTGK